MKIKRDVFVAVSLGIVLGALLVGLQVLVSASHMDEYQQIQLGMTWGEAKDLLWRNDIACESPNVRCAFSDPWREYRIYFDPKTKLVNGKAFAYRQPPTWIRLP
ncbi:MAG: hypothetical protein L0212_04470 [Acidobacteria bacterium]|nr:hypothetical protein [Acidobacteriota bacterium]